MNNEVALITGASRGIGKAIATRLKDAGKRVIGTSTSDSNRGDWCDRWVTLNLESRESCQVFEQEIYDEPVTILVNNAGINRIDLTEDIEMDDFDAVVDVNLRGAFQMCRLIGPRMKENGWGRIINIASIWSEISKSGRASYSASKAGVLGLTRALSAEYAKYNVLVNAVSPGFIATELTYQSLSEHEIQTLCQQVPIGRLGKPEEIANLVAWLASTENTFVSGQNIIIDGGFTHV